MKSALLAVGVAIAVLASAGIAWSSGVLGGGPAQIRVYGGGQVSAIGRTISIDANANPQGLEAYGTFRYAATPPGFVGHITCLTMSGNSALVGGVLSQPDAFAGSDFLYAVTDNGPPGSGADEAGFIDVTPELDAPPYPGLPANFPQTCPPTIDLQVFGAFPLTGDASIETP